MEAGEISLEVVYKATNDDGTLAYEGVSFVENKFPDFVNPKVVK